MAINITFDTALRPELPNIILLSQSGLRICCLPIQNLVIYDAMNEPSELSFEIYKKVNGIEFQYWNEIKDFRLVYIPEWKKYYVIQVQIEEGNAIIKKVSCTSLHEYELSQTRLFGVEINTEKDISRDDYQPTVLYKKEDPSISLIDRLIHEKASHYTILHIDKSIQSIQRTFSFDNISIYDAFNEIAEEINCIFIFGETDSNSSLLYGDFDDNAKIYAPLVQNQYDDENLTEVYASNTSDFSLMRTISVYDLYTSCNDCGYRGNFTHQCPKCNSFNINNGYGQDTTIFVSKENLSDDITLTSDKDSVKNCFRLEAGDDLMTATIINASPSGSQYIWHFTDEMKEDMSDGLKNQLEEYDNLYEYYDSSYEIQFNSYVIDQYNALINKYIVYDEDLNTIDLPVTGYANMMKIYYDVIDFYGFLNNSLLPNVEIDQTTAQDQAKLLTSETLSPVSVQNIQYISLATANSTILNYAKVFIDTSKYKVRVQESDISGTLWSGILLIENYYDDEDIASTNRISVTFNDNYENFIKQEIEKVLAKNKSEDSDIVELFKLDETQFANKLKQYSYTHLQILNDACQSCIDVLIEQGIGDSDSWKYTSDDLYTSIYQPMYNKKELINSELIVREKELQIISGKNDENGDIEILGIKNMIEEIRSEILDHLDFTSYMQDYIGELNLFRREDVWSNDNYISDGLNNNELFENAIKFLEAATQDLIESSEKKYKISCPLKNLLIIDGFEQIVDYFEVGNWIRIQVDNSIYKLRLLSYEVQFNSINSINVEFSDTTRHWDAMDKVKDVLEQSKSIAKSYTSTKRQADKSKVTTDIVDNWVENGIDTTITQITSGDNNDIVYDKHGLLFRKFDSILNDYSPEQICIIHSTLAMTNDNWKTSKVGIGKFRYFNPKTQQVEDGYGLIADQIVGGLLLSEEIGIYNASGTMSFDDENGLRLTNGTNTFVVNPNNTTLLSIKKGNVDVFSVSDTGELNLTGNVIANNLILGTNGLYESNSLNSVSISRVGESIFTLQKDNTKVLYFNSSGDLCIKGNIEASSLSVNDTFKIDISNIDGLEDVIKTNEVIGTLPSINGNVGFIVSDNGLLKSNGSQLFNAIIYTSSGNIAGFLIENNLISSNTDTYKYGLSSNVENDEFIFAGCTNNALENANFRLYKNGDVHVKNVDINGKFYLRNQLEDIIFGIDDTGDNIVVYDQNGNPNRIVSSSYDKQIKLVPNENILDVYINNELFSSLSQSVYEPISNDEIDDVFQTIFGK